MKQTVIRTTPWILGVLCAALFGGALMRAGTPQLPLEPFKERFAGITPAYEGWYANADGSFSILLGYFNRNAKQPLDIPVGPNNKIEPGPADQGQPTYFEVGRQWGVLVIKVPKDFGKKTVTWTITANGETQAIPFNLNNPYNIAPLKEIGMNNQPPVIWFADGGPKFTGPPIGTAATLTTKVKTPTAIKVWAQDPKGRGQEAATAVATLSFHKYRGPGAVTFDRARIPVPKQGDAITANATFSEPGEYTVRVQANDESGEGGGGFQCCWTNTYVKVTVTP